MGKERWWLVANGAAKSMSGWRPPRLMQLVKARLKLEHAKA